MAEGNQVDSIFMMDYRDAQAIKRLSVEYIKPYFDQLPDEQFHRIKETWRYALNKYDDELLINSFERSLPPFETPVDIRRFYIDVWKSVFNDEPWKIEYLEGYTDLQKPNLSPWDDIN